MTEPLSILVFGAGAIGTYIGGSLALSGHRLTFIERPEGAAVLRTNGLRLDLKRAGLELRLIDAARIHTASSLQEALTYGPFDLAIFALKSYDTAAAVEEMKPCSGQLPVFLCLQNGVENESVLASVLGEEKVIACTVTSSVSRRGVGDIVLERLRGIGVADGHPLSLFIWQALQTAGVKPRLYRHALDMKWSKMLTNLPANATAAILDRTPAEVFDHAGLFRLEMRMLKETLVVMRALRLRVVNLPGVPTRLFAFAVNLPAFLSRPLLMKAIGGGRGAKMPSFHIDLHAGRGASEVDWLNGAVVRHGAHAGVKTPVNRFLNETLIGLTLGSLPANAYARQAEKFLSDLAAAGERSNFQQTGGET